MQSKKTHNCMENTKKGIRCLTKIFKDTLIEPIPPESTILKNKL